MRAMYSTEAVTSDKDEIAVTDELYAEVSRTDCFGQSVHIATHRTSLQASQRWSESHCVS